MKQIIADSFVEMAKRKPFDKITVKDLVEECGISRQTFYYHFQDIVDVVEWIYQQSINKALAFSTKTDSPQEVILSFIQTANESSVFIKKLLNSQKRTQIEQIVVNALRTYLREMMRHKAPDLNISHSDTEILLDFYTYGIAGILLENCGKPNLNEAKLADQIYRLIMSQLIINQNS